MSLSEQLTWIHVDTGLENLRRILPDRTKNTDLVVFIDGQEVGEFHAWDTTKQLCEAAKKAFPGRFGFVVRTTEPAEANYIRVKDRSLWVTENGEGCKIKVSTYGSDEDYHKKQVQLIKDELESIGILPIKGTCVYTFREEC